MQPQIRVHVDTEKQYYFQFITSEQRPIFESTRFATKPLCAQAIGELKTTRQLENYIHKVEQDYAFSFFVTSKKKLIIGRGKQHWGFMGRNLDIRVLLQELPSALIIENEN